MKRYRNTALALSCAFTAASALATNGAPPPPANNNVNWNWNHNTNRTFHRSTNTSTNTNTLNNKNSNWQKQQQHQSQSQSQTLRNSGNSSSNAVGHGGQGGQGGRGGQGGQGGQGGHVSNAGNHTGNSSAAAVSAASGNSTSVVGDVNNYQAPPRQPVASAIAPSLVSGADTCMGSTTVGAQGVGLGVSFGNTWTDDNCVMLKNSTMLWNMGKADAAVALLCNNAQIRKALEQAGTPCPDGRQAPKAVAAPPIVQTMAVPEPQVQTYIEPAMSARNRVDKN